MSRVYVSHALKLGSRMITKQMGLRCPASQITVHGGFLSAYDSIRPQIFMLVDAITESGTSEAPWRVHVTGHSLGGALATLCAYELATRQ